MDISHALPFNFSQLIGVIRRLPSKEKLVLFELLKEDTIEMKKPLKISDKLKGSIPKDKAIELSNEIDKMRDQWDERTF